MPEDSVSFKAPTFKEFYLKNATSLSQPHKKYFGIPWQIASRYFNGKNLVPPAVRTYWKNFSKLHQDFENWAILNDAYSDKPVIGIPLTNVYDPGMVSGPGPRGNINKVPGNVPVMIQWALKSADEMFLDWVQERLNAGEVPDLDGFSTWGVYHNYYLTSLDQYASDAQNIANGEPQVLVNYAFDGRAPFSVDDLKNMKFADRFKQVKQSDSEILDEMLYSDLTDREIVEISRNLVTDPASHKFVESLVDQVVPKSGNEFEKYGEDAFDLNPITNRFGESVIDQALRDIESQVNKAPEYWTSDVNKELSMNKALTDFSFWKQNYPAVSLLPGENPHIDPILLRNTWPSNQPPPLVNLHVLPRKKKMPELGFLAEVFTGPLGAIIAAIPTVGQVIALVGSMAAGAEMSKYAKDFQRGIPSSVFEPQYEPKAFTVPLPLDRAQLAIEKPWLLPALVEQFRQEILNQNILSMNVAYYQLTGEGLPTKQSLISNGVISLTPTGRASFLIGGKEVSAPMQLTTNGGASGSGGNSLLAIGAIVAALAFLNS